MTTEDSIAGTRLRLRGLAGRRTLVDRLVHAVARSERSGVQVGLVLLDLVGFREVNDSYGRATGDALLRFVGRLVRDELRESDTVARLEADQFAVLVEDAGSAALLSEVTERLLAAIEQRPFVVAHATIPVRAAAGLAVSGTDAATLWADASAALTTAKEAGGGWQPYRPEVRAALRARLELGAELREAIDRDEFVVVYQPIVEIANGRPIGLEALVRWEHRMRGTVAPIEFLDVAERIRLMPALGQIVLRAACADLRRWRDSDTAAAPRWVAVNVAADQFVAPDFVDAVHAAVHDNGLRARDLALEITEGVLLLDVPQLQVTINNLKAMGVSLVVDDFGTGFAGLEYFRRYGIDGLKIDRSFVAALLETQEQAAIVTAALRFADALGLTVTAEGIETVEQADWLRAAGCRFGQGYLYARPLPFDGVTKFFAAA